MRSHKLVALTCTTNLKRGLFYIPTVLEINICNKTQTTRWSFSLAVFTLDDEQIIWHLSVWCEFMSYFRRFVRLDGQIFFEKIVFPGGQISVDLSVVEKFVRPVCISDDLFVL